MPISTFTTADRPPTHYHYTDFYSTAVHELGHVLGIHNPALFQLLVSSDPNFCVAWMSWVQSDGQGGYVFTGAQPGSATTITLAPTSPWTRPPGAIGPMAFARLRRTTGLR